MSFSQRTALAAPVDQAESAGAVDLTQTNPTHCGLGVLAQLPAVDRYDPEPLGLPVAREAVARWYGGAVPSTRVVLSASTSEAYGWLFKLLADPGDEVLVAQPGYPLCEHLGALEGLVVRGFGLRFDGEWRLELPRLLEVASARTRAVVVVSPGNPTGAYLPDDDFTALQRLCATRGWALLVDEVFAAPERSFAGRPCEALTFFLGGLSKAAGLPQLKLAWTVVSGPAPLADEALRRLDFLADCALSVSTPVQLALPELLDSSAAFRRAVGERCVANRAVLAGLRAPEDSWQLLPAEAGWVAVLRVPEQPREEERVRSLARLGVKVQPGYFFDFHAGAHLVVSLLLPPELFSEGARRLVAGLRSG